MKQANAAPRSGIGSSVRINAYPSVSPIKFISVPLSTSSLSDLSLLDQYDGNGALPVISFVCSFVDGHIVKVL